MRVLGLVTHVACSTEVLAFGSDASGLFQEHDDPQRVNEQSWHKAQQQKEPKALFPGSKPCC